MAAKVNALPEVMDKPSQRGKEVLVEQVLWLIKLRWIAVGGIVIAAFTSNYAFSYPLLTTTVPIYACAGLLLSCNIIYFCVATRKTSDTGPKNLILAIIQVEADLIILTAILYFSGGVVNPFFLFYIFHIIIATIILPMNLSFIPGLTAILLFGLLAVNELSAGTWLETYPLQFLDPEGMWENPVYVLGVFVAFVFTMVLARYLTGVIIVRMRSQERQAARNNDILNAVINAMAEGLIFVTGDGKVAICNPAATLWKKNDSLDKGVRFEDLPRVLTEYINDLLGGADKVRAPGRIIEFTTVGPQGRYIEAKGCSVTGIDGEQLGYVIVGQDLTRHKKLEKNLREQTEQVAAINEMLKISRIEMAHREKMVAIGQMAAGIAHEIGNPLASLSSVAQYLGRKLTKHEEKEHLLVIEHQVSRISDILKRMLSLSRPATGEYKWTDIGELIDNTLSLIKFDKRMQSIMIKNITGYDLPMVWLNPQLFEQVLLNIIINSLDAMNTKTGEQEHILGITRRSKDGMIEIKISDTGIGMSPQVAKRAFESFFTTKEIGKGTGLGLFISYNLVSEIDGTIELESELNKGTTVTIQIPIRPQKNLITGGDARMKFVI